MACCKCCCGNADCSEGQQGKCCCGEACCSESQCCCSGECKECPCCDNPDPTACTADSDCNYCVRTYPASGGINTGGVELICPDGYISLSLTPEERECYKRDFLGPISCPCDPEPGTIQIEDENAVTYTVSQGTEVFEYYCCDTGCSVDTCPP